MSAMKTRLISEFNELKQISGSAFKKLILVIPSADKEMHTANTSTGTVIPLGVCSIATTVREFLPDIEIIVLDGDVESEDSIEKTISRDVDDKTLVGISCKTINNENSKVIGKIAKGNGATVAIGGQYISSRGLLGKNGEEIVPTVAKDILRFNDFYDYSISGEGEITMVQLLKGIKPEQVYNLSYRSNGDVVSNELVTLNLDCIPMTDRSFVDKYLPEYSRLYKEQFKFLKSNTHQYKISFYSQKGCYKAVQSAPCSFCSIYDVDRMRSRNPINVWDELRMLSGKYGDIVAYDVCDDFIGDISYFHELRKSKPKDVNVALRIYLRADQIIPETLEQLKEIGVDEVFVGAESADAECLRNAVKKTTPEDNYNAIKLLAQFDFLTNLGMIFGLKGENEQSVNANVEFAKKCSEIKNFRYYINTTMVVPYRGCGLYNSIYIKNKDFRSEEYRNFPRRAMLYAMKEWNKEQCKVDLNFLEDAITRALEYTPVKISMSRTFGN